MLHVSIMEHFRKTVKTQNEQIYLKVYSYVPLILILVCMKNFELLSNKNVEFLTAPT